jgi:vacuolar iron transporter family protein
MRAPLPAVAGTWASLDLQLKSWSSPRLGLSNSALATQLAFSLVLSLIVITHSITNMPATDTSPLLPQPRSQAPASVSDQGIFRPNALNRRRTSVISTPRRDTMRSQAPNGNDDGDNLEPQTSHRESHSSHFTDVLRDMIIGFADGLTVPFALTAGLSSLNSTKLVIIGGLAELFSGMISMGLGAYLAAVTERQHWEAEHARECWEVENVPDAERKEVYEILGRYGVSKEAADGVVRELCSDKKEWVRFMMDLELRLDEPEMSRAWISAATMGLSYFVGGLIPMIPYFVMKKAQEALFVSIAITVVILLGFGFVKSYVTVHNKKAGLWGALQTLLVGALAAGTSYGIVRLIDDKS